MDAVADFPRVTTTASLDVLERLRTLEEAVFGQSAAVASPSPRTTEITPGRANDTGPGPGTPQLIDAPSSLADDRITDMDCSYTDESLVSAHGVQRNSNSPFLVG